MINVAKNLYFKIILCDLDYKTGFYNLKKLRKKINNRTTAIVLTNMFNSYEEALKLKKICKTRKIYLIEDNAIYFDNYKILKKVKKYSGTLVDFTLYSFNIMNLIIRIHNMLKRKNWLKLMLNLRKTRFQLEISWHWKSFEQPNENLDDEKHKVYRDTKKCLFKAFNTCP